jgi:hypothetical protein
MALYFKIYMHTRHMGFNGSKNAIVVRYISTHNLKVKSTSKIKIIFIQGWGIMKQYEVI